MTPVFIVTSALVPEYGIVSLKERLEQTIRTILCIRKMSAEASIVFVDSSPYKLDHQMAKEIIENVSYFAELGTNNPGLNEKFESRHPFTFLSTLKAVCESYAVIHALT